MAVKMSRTERNTLLEKHLRERILVLDGAMGTSIQNHNLTANDFGGAEYEGCNEYLVITRPDVIAGIHESYLKVGADIIETNTFGGTPLVLGEFGLADKAYEINLAAVQLARSACKKYETAENPRFVAGSIGPTTKAISVTGGITFEELIEQFYAQAKALYDGGVDYFLVETCQDTRNIKAALLGIDKLFNGVKEKIPVAVSVTIEPTGTMLAGQSIESLAISLAHRDLLYIGLNCATGPEFMTDHIRTLAGVTKTRVACVPNAGLPDENGHYLETPAMIAKVLERFCEHGWINFLGGCCGTTPEHIKALSELAKKFKPRTFHVIPAKAGIQTPLKSLDPDFHRDDEIHTFSSYLSGIDFLEVSDEKRPLIVGERTNVIGSRKFKRLICEEKFDEASEIARAQVKNGAQIIDICLANPDRNEMDDMRCFLEQVTKKIRVPLMIDSTDADVIEMSLTYSQGKAIINSINLEDGEERFEKVVPLAKKFGAALIVGTIDEDPKQGMGVTRQRKLEIAERAYKLLTEKYGIAEEDIYWDSLVFPCATGDAQYIGSAVETIEGIRLIKQKFPRTKSVLGVSNVSFGLPIAGREVLNAVFLHHCTQAGLDMAIVNAELLTRYASIPPEEIELANNLLYNKGADCIAVFANHFREKRQESRVSSLASLPLEERLAHYIIEGTKDGLTTDLDIALKERQLPPLEIINGPLMKGMDEVGRLFNNNELIVAEVLQSAEAMKAAVDYLKPHMKKTDTSSRGRVVLATVKGDVHDIGKNLVDIILTNNGFEVINLGIKIPSEQLIEAVKKYKPDILGLSGLLVKSAQQMELSADDLCQAGIDLPILVGGAALTRNFVNRRIAKAYKKGFVCYAKDAMEGLDLAKKILNPKQFEEFRGKIQKEQVEVIEVGEQKAEGRTPKYQKSSVPILKTIPQPPDFKPHVLTNTPLDHIWNFINPRMLFGRHLGVKGSLIQHLEREEWGELKKSEEGKKVLEICDALEDLKKECRGHSMKAKAIYQFFPAYSEGNTLYVNGTAIEFPRQNKEPWLCLTDYAAPKNGPADNAALFVVTAGEGIRELAETYKKEGQYLKSHMIQALALESAEAYAELLHSKIRAMWGFPDTPDMTMMQRFQAKYHGKRYSFGYPACPNLESQKVLFDLLHPEQIGVQLTEGFMMEPEASVSAIVFHHPKAIYFSA